MNKFDLKCFLNTKLPPTFLLADSLSNHFKIIDKQNNKANLQLISPSPDTHININESTPNNPNKATINTINGSTISTPIFNLKPKLISNSPYFFNHLYSVAPMLDVTDLHFRTLVRLLSNHCMLYTEMIHCDTILMSKSVDAYLYFDPIQHPITLQLGGSNPEKLALAAKLAVEKYGYDEINLNCGCPSPRVTCGSFGACLMKSPEVVVECINAMRAVVDVPVTIKCRLGVDEDDSYEFIRNFIAKISEDTKMDHFVVHARKAFLKGLNPKENRTVPPLKHELVLQLASDFPRLNFSINGGVKSLATISDFLKSNQLLGCMVGRYTYDDIWHLSHVDRLVYGQKGKNLTRREVLVIYGEYCDLAMSRNPVLNCLTLVKPLVSLLVGHKGTTVFRQFLSKKENYTKSLSFQKYFEEVIVEVDKANPTILDEHPFEEESLV